MRQVYQILLLCSLVICVPRFAAQAAPASSAFADPAFQAVWQRADGPVDGGNAGRSWTWGAQAGPRSIERYAESPGATRLVQYFDKARMEITQPGSDRASEWFATNGLLVVELIGGRVQHGNARFEDRTPAAIQIAGDPGAGNGPTYATLRPFATLNDDHRATDRTGQPVMATLDAAGGLGTNPALASPASEVVFYEPVTGHNVPRAFVDFQRSLRSVTNVLGTFGHPISEPYWTSVRVGGQTKTVLFQAFERRILTYTPTNPDPWKVEMGNVGQHYRRWRYGAEMFYPAAAFSGVRISEGSVEIPTYDYQPALVPTAPGDPIYPYARIDRSKLGPIQPKAYRLIRLENRYLALSFLPELGGRIYQLSNKATGNNVLYQNPVIKPSAFGQRGWWLAAGGIEWAAPTEEHGYLEYVPWNVRTESSASKGRVIISTTEQHTGVELEIGVELAADSALVTISGSYRNTSPTAQPFQFWMNAMVAPGAANRLSDDLHFVVPGSQMIVHATQDPGLPAPHEVIAWPQHQGRDLSRYRTWNGYIGLFAAQDLRGTWAGVYDPGADEGLTLVNLSPTLPGIKTFAFGKQFDRGLFTDDGSDYAELWHGAQRTFWDYPPLASGANHTFQATWQPLHGLGDLAAGSARGSAGLTRTPDGTLVVAIQVAQPFAAAPVHVLRADGTVLWSGSLALAPDQPLRLEVPTPVAPGAPVSIEWGGEKLITVAP